MLTQFTTARVLKLVTQLQGKIETTVFNLSSVCLGHFGKQNIYNYCMKL